jgi:hypothetical protein
MTPEAFQQFSELQRQIANQMVPPDMAVTQPIQPEMVDQLEGLINDKLSTLRDTTGWNKNMNEAAQRLATEKATSGQLQGAGPEVWKDPSEALRRDPQGLRRMLKQIEQEKLATRRAGAPKTTIRMPAGERGRVMKEAWDADATLEMIGRIEQYDFDKFLGYMNRAEHWWKNVQDQARDVPGVAKVIGKMSPKERKDFEEASAFYGEIDQFMATEFHKLIGSAQTVQEVKNVAGAILNKKMSPGRFRANLIRLKRLANATAIKSRELLGKGFKTGTKRYRKAMDEHFKASGLLRGPRAQRATPDDVLRRWRAGEITQDEARTLMEQNR